ncbi:MAG: DUF3037 domain-containing protein [Chloroflexi bacterium]|nr:DUF3037 domain-containing protein [Chloroflexota bacterium]
MDACRYVIAKFVSDPIRDEPLNIGVILQCPSRKFIASRFLTDFRRITWARPEVEAHLLRAFCKEFNDKIGAFSNPFGLPFIPEPPEHQSVIEPQFLDEVAAQYGNRFQFTAPRGTLTTDPVQELEHLFHTFVAERPHEIKPQRIGPARLRNKLYMLFDKSQLLVARLVQYQFTLPGKIKEDGWQFDFGSDNHNISIYQSLALDASEEEHKIDQAMILRGRIKDVRDAAQIRGNHSIEAYAITHTLPQDSNEYAGTTEARRILTDGDIEVIPFQFANDFVSNLRTQLMH